MGWINDNIYLECDGRKCSNYIKGIDEKEIINKAQNLGWIRIMEYGETMSWTKYCCPECKEKYLKGLPTNKILDKIDGFN